MHPKGQEDASYLKVEFAGDSIYIKNLRNDLSKMAVKQK
jgi:hypothetical protein